MPIKINTVSGLQLFQVIRFAGIFFTSILLAKAGISIGIIGNYEKILLISGAVSFFWVQGILTSLLSGYYDHALKKVYLFNAFILITFFSAVVYGLLQLFSDQVQSLFFDDVQPGYRLMCLYILFNSPCFLIETIYLLKKKTKNLITYGIVSACFSMGIVVIPLILGYPVDMALSFLVLWAIVRFFWLIRLLLKHATPDFSFSYLRSHFSIAWPLIISYLIGGSADYIDGLMATHFFGGEAFAVFRYGAREFPLSLLLANALSTAMIPVLREGLNGALNLNELKSQSSRLMNLIFPLSIILMYSSSFLYAFVFDYRFEKSALIFNIYLLLAISRMVFPQSIALALNKNKVVLMISIVEILVNIVTSYFLMLKFGIVGIAYGTIIASTAEKLMLCSYLQLELKIPLKTYIPVTQWLIYILLLIASFIITISA